ncbi:MAG TPA: sigma-70 family RNA polymerase sigma factor [Sporichthya sp.]|nr:sigma-70 family RNA polymerase sigma factor [Sporichthya sp.]
MTAETSAALARARAGDGEAFQQLTEPYRRELQVHCYRMLGSYQDAEDAVQDTLLSAWQALAGFEGRSSVRTWLYRIATNRCLNLLRSVQRRATPDGAVAEFPEPTGTDEVVWLQPYPDAMLDGLLDPAPGPAARYEQAEAISLAFIHALQLLPARQRAVLVLRDVLGYSAAEVADLLDSSVESVTSALKRARATVASRPRPGNAVPAPAPNSPAELALVEAFVRAYGSSDVEALVALLTEDVRISMPPLPIEYAGRDAVARFFAVVYRDGRRFDLVQTRANGQLAFGVYRRDPNGIRRGLGLTVLTLAGGQICGLTRFENEALAWFGLPRSLPD